MNFFGDPWEPFSALGPPTRLQPQWMGHGYKHYVFDGSPVAHVIAPDGVQHQMIHVDADDAHLPVESQLLGYIRQTGYNPSQFQIPEHQSSWDYLSEQFGLPDTRPGFSASQLPSDTARYASGDVNPLTGKWPSTMPRRRGVR